MILRILYIFYAYQYLSCCIQGQTLTAYRVKCRDLTAEDNLVSAPFWQNTLTWQDEGNPVCFAVSPRSIAYDEIHNQARLNGILGEWMFRH